MSRLRPFQESGELSLAKGWEAMHEGGLEGLAKRRRDEQTAAYPVCRQLSPQIHSVGTASGKSKLYEFHKPISLWNMTKFGMWQYAVIETLKSLQAFFETQDAGMLIREATDDEKRLLEKPISEALSLIDTLDLSDPIRQHLMDFQGHLRNSGVKHSEIAVTLGLIIRAMDRACK
jgi:hypothetical protein